MRMAVAALVSTFLIPTFARREVAAANTADSRAKISQERLDFSSVCLMSIMRYVPAAMTARKISFNHHSLLSSAKKTMARRTARTVLDLSTAATFETFPSERALK